ncbi:hypothetical protein HOK51_04785 [Candidatus Woesearchaeota archaeon]|jgi:hypothetical protein|nr:hypothetical protein [Candidatus Woesearchaeota archaeon]MBT6519141.1 hypothetical protein [Candidatus Woesearchaeota archaeon]MBT7367774.1 hypothetical protein [Candidatus Woesearchaeota archaeon]
MFGLKIPKDESYANYVAKAISNEELRIVLLDIQKEDFQLHDPDYIRGYFKQLGLEYTSEDDIDKLSLCITKRLDSEQGSKSTEIVERKIGRKKLGMDE